MHKLIDFICEELEELERKADKEGKLSMSEIQYMDTLAHTKKNLLKADEMMEDSEGGSSYMMGGGSSYRRGGSSYDGGESGQSRRMSSRRGGGSSYRGGSSYARGRGGNARRDSMGRYSRDGYSMAGDEMIEELRELMQDAPDDQTRQEFQKFIQKIEQMG